MMQVSVTALDKKVFEGKAKSVVIPTQDGEATILPHHMPYIAPMDVGKVEVDTPEGMKVFTIGKGLCVFSENKLDLLIEDVKQSDELNEARALEAQKKAEEIMKSGIKGVGLQKALYQYRRSIVDLKLVRKRKRTMTS